MLSKLLVKIALGVGVPLGTLSVGAMPGAAAIVSLENPTIGGDRPTDFILRCGNTTPGVSVPMGSVELCPPGVTLENVLKGGPVPPAGNLGGNVELRSIISPAFDFNEFTSREGTLLGKPFFARSLTANDWFANDNAVTKQFLNDALVANNVNPIFFNPTIFNTLVDTFITQEGPQRFSDPNITYVFADDTTGTVTVGLAGVLNASNLLKLLFAGVVDPALIPDEVQVSEVVYVDYYKPSLLYSFSAANSGQSSNNLPFIPACPGGAPTDENDLANCDYTGDFHVTKPIPGLMTLLGAVVALGFGAKFKQKRSNSQDLIFRH